VKLLIYDGECGLCHWAVAFLIKRLNKKSAQIRFISSTSTAGDYLLKKFNFDPTQLDSLVLYDKGQILLRSLAVSSALQECRFLWPLVGKSLIYLPGRDWLYNKVAQNRQKIMGKNSCSFDVSFGSFSLHSKEQLKEFYSNL
jgi:predicted DCC family thiol-disulfide oxidoreductase YuxK